MKAVWDYIRKRLQEPSTWTGIAMVLTAAGPLLASGDWKAAVAAAAGALGIVLPEKS